MNNKRKKTLKKKESDFWLSEGGVNGKWLLANKYGIPSWTYENVLEFDDSNGHTTLWLYWKVLNHTFQNVNFIYKYCLNNFLLNYKRIDGPFHHLDPERNKDQLTDLIIRNISYCKKICSSTLLFS
jgi:hypothetical protein